MLLHRYSQIKTDTVYSPPFDTVYNYFIHLEPPGLYEYKLEFTKKVPE